MEGERVFDGRLTKRKREVFALLMQGAPTKMIAHQLGISPKTVEKHLTSIYRKYGVSSRVDLLVKWGDPDRS